MKLTPKQLAALVLGEASLVDSRVPQPDELVLKLWTKVLETGPAVTLEQGEAIVVEHYSRQNVPRIMPGDVLAAAKAIAPPDRPRLQLLPSGFESDVERDARLARGAAAARQALTEVRRRRLEREAAEEAAQTDEDDHPDTATGGQP